MIIFAQIIIINVFIIIQILFIVITQTLPGKTFFLPTCSNCYGATLHPFKTGFSVTQDMHQILYQLCIRIDNLLINHKKNIKVKNQV